MTEQPYRAQPSSSPPFRRSGLQRWWRRVRAKLLRKFIAKHPYCPDCRCRHSDWSWLHTEPAFCWRCIERQFIEQVEGKRQ